MAGTRSQAFTSSGMWNSGSASAVWVTMVGGGSGNPGGTNGTGGGGAGELVCGRLVSVTPNTDYAVTVGTKGMGKDDESQPDLPTSSSFNGVIALGARVWPEVAPGVARGSGSGGGAGGPISNAFGAGFDHRGIREASCFFGGGAGRQGGVHTPVDTDDTCGVHGGPVPINGAVATAQTNVGGAGAGSLWGGTNGGDGIASPGPLVVHVNYDMNAAATDYGAGAGGNFQFAAGGDALQGGDGGNGYVLLMWAGA